MVAKSYQNLEVVGDVFTTKGRKYVQVRTKTGALKTVRWYTEKEYAKMYPDEVVEQGPSMKSQKQVLGFENGFITIFKGNTYEEKEYFKLNSARYSRWWGWYFISTETIPEDLPDDVEPIRLDWELVGNEDGSLKPENTVIAAVESLTYEPDVSEYQGEVGDKVDVIVTVEKAIQLDGFYGPSTLYTMRDYDGNVYIWTTASVKTKLEEEETYHLRGTVKAHKSYKRQKQTVLMRCAIVK